jgi:hypothetical protein
MAGSSRTDQLYLDEEDIIQCKLNSQVIGILKDEQWNKKGLTFLVFLDND